MQKSALSNLINRHKLVFCLLSLGVFWLCRSQYYSGDGDQISRMTAAGVWMVNSELLSQALFQLGYQILHGYGWDALSVLNLVSCVAGAASVWMLLIFNQQCARVDPLWALALFCSSGLLLFCNGHTEYYTMFLAALFWYGYAGVRYLQNRCGAFVPALAFSVAGWMHLGILFAFPSLVLLPLLKRDPFPVTKENGSMLAKEYGRLALGLSALAVAFLMKKYQNIFGVEIHGLSPSNNFIPLLFDPGKSWSYTLFSPWHIIDWIYAWLARSWIFWPMVLWGAWLGGFWSLARPDRAFLLTFTLCFTVFSFVWHPNLGIDQDWDLFAIEAAPCLLLLLTYIPEIAQTSWRRAVAAVPIAASIIIMFGAMLDEAHFGRRGHGSVRVTISKQDPMLNLTYNGHKKDVETRSIHEGVYSAKVIDTHTRDVYDFFVHIVPESHLEVPLRIKEEGKKQPLRWQRLLREKQPPEF